MTLFKKTVVEAVVEVVKPAVTVYNPQFTADEMAQLILAIGATSGITYELFVKLRKGLGIEAGELPDADSHITKAAVARTVALMK